jgi:hypothetical protein
METAAAILTKLAFEQNDRLKSQLNVFNADKPEDIERVIIPASMFGYPAPAQSLKLSRMVSIPSRTTHMYRPQLTHCRCFGKGFLGGMGIWIAEPHSHLISSSLSSLASLQLQD